MTNQQPTNQELWNRYCEYFRVYPELGLSLDISRVRIADDFFDKMQGKMSEAFSAMAELEKGAIANPDEQRMVGHYWLRNPDTAPDEQTGKAIAGMIDNIKQFAADVHSGKITPENSSKFKNVLLIGIGGSALGPQLVEDALDSADDKMKMFYVDNTDPDGIARTVRKIGAELDETVCLIISKSGGTVETRNGALEIAAAFKDAGLSFAKHAIAITCEGSKLDNQAAEEGWLNRFYLWDWVGGRTSVFSAVGLVPAALQGIDVEQMLDGASAMDDITRVPDADRNPAALLALMWYAAGDGAGKKDMVILPYKDRLCLFSKYLQQLVMESLGKEHDLDGKVVNQGIAVYGNKGSTDQHAYVQQLRDGVNNFFATFIEVLGDYSTAETKDSSIEVEEGVTSGDYLNGFFQGTRKALYESNRDSITITINELSPRTLGALIALYERAVGLYATLVNINAYHQPGVEAGKKAAARVIELQRQVVAELGQNKGGAFSAEELSDKIGAQDDVETVYKVLEHLAANSSVAVSREGEQHPRSARFLLG